MITAGQVWLAASVAGGAIALASPLHAQSSTEAAPATAPIVAEVAPTPVGDPGVEAYYASHPAALIWLGTPDARLAAAELPEILRQAPIDGLEDGPALAAAVETALDVGQSAGDKIISTAWVRYVQRLKAPVEGISYADLALTLKAPSAETILTDAAQAISLTDYVAKVAAVNPLYSALRDEAVKQGAQTDPRVRATLNRLRLIPASGRAVVVDVPSARLLMIEDGRVVDSMKVIVGKKSGATPILASTIHYVTFNPYWHIPQDIARVRVAPVVLKRGVAYLKLARYETVAAFGGEKEQPIDPTTVDWKAVTSGDAEVHVRQLAGPQNMMGRMKIGFANDYGVFLHDTPDKKLFAREKRFLSHGCIRLERPEKLASWLLGREATPPNDDSELNVRIEKGVPIYLSYMSARPAEGGTLAFAEDIYGLDTPGAVKAALVTTASAE
jgi:murein L,D-transpeptidase YcbB/YkuD